MHENWPVAMLTVDTGFFSVTQKIICYEENARTVISSRPPLCPATQPICKFCTYMVGGEGKRGQEP